ncbi:MAG TPA: DUF6166 domain-containing protein [Candidatus Sulfotelmatobacter sp.]|nr:DUF6166 domain-containing protein [Candidatus Sulfotelmatobacter sp.]
MQSTRKTGRDWPSLRFARIDVTSPQEVADFVIWLSDWGIRPGPSDDGDSVPEPEAMLELMWGWDGAPKKRMAKLLWQFLVGNDSPEFFHQQFATNPARVAVQIASSIHHLTPIQQNLNWILNGLIAREREDVSIGQGSWGEDWWLPRDEAAYLRQQIRRARPDLIEESSSYEDCMEYASVPYFEVESQDSERTYVGSLFQQFREFVEIVDADGKRRPLAYPRYPFRQRPGTGFSWGYPGRGPAHLAVSILADAVGGDYEIAEKLRDDFVADVLTRFRQHTPFRLPRRDVLIWAEAKKVGSAELALGAARVAELKRLNESALAEHKARLQRIRDKGGLVAQRFDLVPEDFECALYVDLMQTLERTGWVLRCSRCKQPLPCPPTPTGNRQRARWVAGRPVYHEECFVEHRLEHKRSYWKERTKSPAFRSQERARARKGRKAL